MYVYSRSKCVQLLVVKLLASITVIRYNIMQFSLAAVSCVAVLSALCSGQTVVVWVSNGELIEEIAEEHGFTNLGKVSLMT